MSDTHHSGTTTGDDSVSIEIPTDPLAGHPATAYFWGHVAASGTVSSDGLEVTTTDETSAGVLATIAGGELTQETTSREYAHDTSITRTEDEYTLSIPADDGKLLGRTSSLSLPVDGHGNYRFRAFSSHRRELLRGILEGCGTICFKSKSDTVGISFVHEDRDLLERIRELIADCPIAAPMGDLGETSSGGYWFGVDDDAAPAFGTWLYESCQQTGLYAPSRRRKLTHSLEQAEADD